MSDFASVVERTRRAFASIARLENALANDPQSALLQVNLAASKKFALKSQEQLFQLSEFRHVDICNYRLIPDESVRYGLSAVASSFGELQNLFSQIYDAVKNGPKPNARIGIEAERESLLELAYTYSGSLGVVLFANNDRSFFEGKLDTTIEGLLRVTDIKSHAEVREVANELGLAVVKRVHDWSRANFRGGFSTDLLWKRSDGRQLGRLLERNRMEHIVFLIEETSDERIEILRVNGVLIGGDLRGTFHFVVPNGPDYRGVFAQDFSVDIEMTLGKNYVAVIREKRTTIYATERVNSSFELIALIPPIRG